MKHVYTIFDNNILFFLLFFERGTYMQKKEGKLKQNITLIEAIGFCVAQVIGTGIFMKPTTVLKASGSTGMAILMWIFAGLITMCTALTLAEVASYKASLGGMTAYVTQYNGKKIGFLSGWFFAILNDTGTLAANSIATATFLSGIISMNDTQLRICAFIIIIVLCSSQMISVQGTMRTQLVGALLQAVPLLLVIILGIFKGGMPTNINFSLIGNPNSPGVKFGIALLGAMWVYDGWQATANLGEEMSNPQRDFPKALFLSMSFLIIIFVLFNMVGFNVISTKTIMISKESFGSNFGQSLMGNTGRYIMAILMVICSLFTLNAEVVQATRDMLYQARCNNLPGSKWIRHIDPKFNTPIHSIMTSGTLALILMLTGTFESISLMTMFFTWVFTLFALYDAFKLRHQKELKRTFNTPLYPIVPLIGIGGAAFMLISSVLSDPKWFVIGIIVILAGIPISFLSHKYLYPNEKTMDEF